MKLRDGMTFAAALVMMAATGGYLAKVHQHTRLGGPGVKLTSAPMYNEMGQQVAAQSVFLPDTVMGIKGSNLPVAQVEMDELPKDTTFGRKLYRGTNHFDVQTSVVLMGTDRTSIHDPQYCLSGQDWHVEKIERVFLPMDRPYSYGIPALKLTGTRPVEIAPGRKILISAVYVYWFVSGEKVTADQNARLWSIARTMLEKGELERWAYISYLTTCFPGQEKATFDHLEQFIRASVPQFQTVTGQAATGRLADASR